VTYRVYDYGRVGKERGGESDLNAICALCILCLVVYFAESFLKHVFITNLLKAVGSCANVSYMAACIKKVAEQKHRNKIFARFDVNIRKIFM